jgi:GMP synthase PP-ATPase subunit
VVASCGLRDEPPSVPGAGLAIRIPGPITREKLDFLRQVDAVYLDHVEAAGDDRVGVRVQTAAIASFRRGISPSSICLTA